MTITDPQRRALAVAAAHPHTSVACSNVTDPARPCISTAVADRLDAIGLVIVARPNAGTLGAWAGTTDAATITVAGLNALAAT